MIDAGTFFFLVHCGVISPTVDKILSLKVNFIFINAVEIKLVNEEILILFMPI